MIAKLILSRSVYAELSDDGVWTSNDRSIEIGLNALFSTRTHPRMPSSGRSEQVTAAAREFGARVIWAPVAESEPGRVY